MYARSIVGDHPFHDGDKRTGITVAGVFHMRNGIRLSASPKALEDLAVSIATDRLDVPVIAAWLASHSS